MAAYYAEDLAFIHDAGYGFLAKAAAAELHRRLRKVGINEGHIVSLGCGSGILLEHFTRHGFITTGIDLSPDLLKIARQRVPAARLEHGSYRNFRIPACEAVTAIGEVLSYRADAKLKGLTSLKKVFRRVQRSLPTGGLFLFDLAGPRRLRSRKSKVLWREEDDWALLLKVSGRGKRLTRQIVTFRKLVHLYRRQQETHVLRLFEPSTVKRLLTETGFRVQVIDRYDELRLPPGLVGFAAVKR
jgi:SAM-dependent methyltransferase